MTDKRGYVGRFEARKDATAGDIDNIVDAIREKGYSVNDDDQKLTNGAIEVHKHE